MSKRGFAAMKPEEQRKIASQGGKAAHAKGTAHEWNSATAKEAGRKGGLASRFKVRAARTPVVGEAWSGAQIEQPEENK